MRFLIVDDNSQMAYGLKSRINRRYGDADILVASTVRDAIELIEGASPPVRLVLLDLVLPDSSGTALLNYLQTRGRNDGMDVIIVSGAADAEVIDRCRALGARGHVPKILAENLIDEAIGAVLSGQQFFPGDQDGAHRQRQSESSLSESQHQVASLLATGKSNKEIADALGIAPGTVKNFLLQLLRFYEVVSRGDLVTKLKEEGVPPG